MGRKNYLYRIFRNILIIILVSILKTVLNPTFPYSYRNNINRIINQNMLGKGEIVYQYGDVQDDIRYDNIFMKYDDQYVYLIAPYSRKFYYANGSTTLLQFDDGLCVVPIAHSDKYLYKKVVVVSQNEDIETIKMVGYNEDGTRRTTAPEMTRYKDTNIFVGDYEAVKENHAGFGYLKYYTAEGYDKDGNLIAVNKCLHQVQNERQVSE